MGEIDSVNAGVIDKLRARAALGKQKYDTTMDRTDLTYSAWLVHTQQELLDACVYIEKLIQLEHLKRTKQ